jgi:hypothetical protein
MSTLQTADKEAVVEQVVGDVVDVVKNGQVEERVNDFWVTHQSEFVHLGKLIVLVVIILILAWMFS